MSSAPESKVRPSAQDIWRTAVTPRWLLALAALVAFIIGCLFLGQWQWDRTQDILAAERAAASEAVQVDELIDNDGMWNNADIGRSVILSGNFTEDELALPNRELDGEAGTWIITRFQLDSGDSIAVVRGFLPASAPAAPADQRPLRIDGVLHPNEEFYEGANAEQIVTIDATALSGEWRTPLIDGYVMLRSQEPEPSSTGGPTPVPPTVQVGNVPFPLQNFFYAIQWWIFAAFAIVVYARWLYLDAKKGF